MATSSEITIQVYLDDGLKFEYNVKTAASAREHTHAIVMTGYRSVVGNELTHYPPHRIRKVKAVGEGISTNYQDTVTGT